MFLVFLYHIYYWTYIHAKCIQVMYIFVNELLCSYNISKYANVYKIKQQNNQNYLNNYIIFTLIIIIVN